MRFDKPVYFQRIPPGKYDALTGDHEEPTIAEEMRYASITDTGVEVMNLVYGGIKQGCLTIRLQNHYTAPFDKIKIGEKVYRVDKARRLRVKHIFVVSEVQ